MNLRQLCLPAVCLLLVSCDAVSERECGVFDHPDLTVWQSETLPPQVTFMAQDGQTLQFNRQAVVFNEPFLGTDGASNDEDVVCELTASVRLQAVDNSLAITSVYQQRERLLIESADETLLVDHRIESPVGIELAGDYPADISVNQVRINLDPVRILYLEAEETEEGADDAQTSAEEDTPMEVLTQEIGGQSYEDVVRINAQMLEPAAGTTQGVAIDTISQLVIARQFGIVEFTNADDQTFVRLP